MHDKLSRKRRSKFGKPGCGCDRSVCRWAGGGKKFWDLPRTVQDSWATVTTISVLPIAGAAVSIPALTSSGAANTLTGSTQHFTEMPSIEGSDDVLACRVLECGQEELCELIGQCSALALIDEPQYARQRMPPAFRHKNPITNSEVNFEFIRPYLITAPAIKPLIGYEINTEIVPIVSVALSRFLKRDVGHKRTLGCQALPVYLRKSYAFPQMPAPGGCAAAEAKPQKFW